MERVKHEEITIGTSDYTREQMALNMCNVFVIGTSFESFLKAISIYENNGYTIEFRTNFFRRIFGVGIYKVVAIKK